MKKKPVKKIKVEEEEVVYLTPIELSKRLKIHVRTLDAWRAREYGPRYKHIGRVIRYPMSSVKAWEEKHWG